MKNKKRTLKHLLLHEKKLRHAILKQNIKQMGNSRFKSIKSMNTHMNHQTFNIRMAMGQAPTSNRLSGVYMRQGEGGTQAEWGHKNPQHHLIPHIRCLF